MKSTLLYLTMILSSFAAIAQNVGIGTSVPSSKLDVRGNLSSLNDFGMFTVGDNSSQQNGLSFGFDGGTNSAWMYARTTGCCGRMININGNLFVNSFAGNVGIGNANPLFKLDISGSVRTTSKYFGRLNIDDTRSVNSPPTDYNSEVAFDFKQINAIGATGSGTFGSLITLAGWGDNSGDAHHQLFFNEGGMFWRQGQPDDANWGTWDRLMTASNVNSFITGDNLGNHSATTTLDMNNQAIVEAGRFEPFGIGTSSGQGNHDYSIFQENGPWTHPYPDLRIAYHTGIKLGAHSGYNGTRFYNNSDMATEIFSVGNGDNAARALYAMHSPIYYDYNDAGYYIDPNSTGLSASRIRGGALHGPNNTWGSYLYVGTDGRQGLIDNPNPSLASTNGNLHIDAGSGFETYINFYDGNTIHFGRGNNSNRATLNGDGFYLYDGWLRPHGQNGIYFQDYGGGWNMTDATWIRAYGGKNIWTPATMQADANMYSPIFYDLNNANYFLNPNGYSNLNEVNISRDGAAECCGNDATLSLAESTSGTGRRASISFHNGGVSEGTLELENVAGSDRRIRLYDNQGQNLGLNLSGAILNSTGSYGGSVKFNDGLTVGDPQQVSCNVYANSTNYFRQIVWNTWMGGYGSWLEVSHNSIGCPGDCRIFTYSHSDMDFYDNCDWFQCYDIDEDIYVNGQYMGYWNWGDPNGWRTASFDYWGWNGQNICNSSLVIRAVNSWSSDYAGTWNTWAYFNYGTNVWSNVYATYGQVRAQGALYANSNSYYGDVAEYFDVKNGVKEPGYIVSIAAKETGKFKLSNKSYDELAIGVISENPSIILNSPDAGIPIALTGRVKVKVNNLGGAIQSGDPITTSSIEGIGMKATKDGAIIGYALETFDRAETGNIWMMIKPSQHQKNIQETSLLQTKNLGGVEINGHVKYEQNKSDYFIEWEQNLKNKIAKAKDIEFDDIKIMFTPVGGWANIYLKKIDKDGFTVGLNNADNTFKGFNHNLTILSESLFIDENEKTSINTNNNITNIIKVGNGSIHVAPTNDMVKSSNGKYYYNLPEDDSQLKELVINARNKKEMVKQLLQPFISSFKNLPNNNTDSKKELMQQLQTKHKDLFAKAELLESEVKEIIEKNNNVALYLAPSLQEGTGTQQSK